MKWLHGAWGKLTAGMPDRSDYAAMAKLAACQMLQYFVVTVNYRAVAQGLRGWTWWSDLACAFIGYWVIRWVGQNKSHWGQVGYVLGGANGSVLGIMLTKQLFGH